jgi:hypothetical protein
MSSSLNKTEVQQEDSESLDCRPVLFRGGQQLALIREIIKCWKSVVTILIELYRLITLRLRRTVMQNDEYV